MKHKVIGIIGVLLLVLGVAIVILQLMAREKSVFRSIGAGGTPILIGGVLLGLSLRLDNKKKASGDPSDTPK